MTVSNLRVTARQLEKRVHDAAKDSFNVTMVPAPVKESMAGMMTFLQVMDCLRKGTIVGRPILREDGLWAFRMQRYASGEWFNIPVYASVKGARVIDLIVDLHQYNADTRI